MIRRIPFLALLAVMLVSPLLLSACSAAAKPAMNDLKMAPLSQLPPEARKSSVSVQEAYQFAIANPDVMKQIPCYCGCGEMGHTSNYSCYIKDDSSGKLTFDTHATGCSICVDITHDTMNMLRQGKSIQQIKATIDQTYSKYGPSNMSK